MQNKKEKKSLVVLHTSPHPVGPWFFYSFSAIVRRHASMGAKGVRGNQGDSVPKARGKKNKLSKRDIRSLILAIKRNQSEHRKTRLYRLTEQANALREGADKVHRTTVSRQLKQAGYCYDRAVGNWPDVKNPSKWLRQRRGFAKVFKSNDKSCILMTDESFFGLKRKVRTNEREWHESGHRMMRLHEPMKPQNRVSVWAAIGLKYWTPLFIFDDGRWLSRNDYGRIIDSFLLPRLAAIPGVPQIGEDQATYHVGEQIDHLFTDNNVKRFFFPAHSPDLNWIEKAWANLADRVYRDDREYSGKDELIAALNREWNAMASNQEYRQALVAQAQRACRKILRNGGYRVHWD